MIACVEVVVSFGIGSRAWASPLGGVDPPWGAEASAPVGTVIVAQNPLIGDGQWVSR